MRRLVAEELRAGLYMGLWVGTAASSYDRLNSHRPYAMTLRRRRGHRPHLREAKRLAPSRPVRGEPDSRGPAPVGWGRTASRI